MKTLDQLFEIIKLDKNVIFCKDFCPFCTATTSLINKLVELEQITNHRMLTLDKDFTNSQLKQIVLKYNWFPKGYQEYPTKPQIFVNSEYIGDNMAFYKSNWNLGIDKPNLKNPMFF